MGASGSASCSGARAWRCGCRSASRRRPRCSGWRSGPEAWTLWSRRTAASPSCRQGRKLTATLGALAKQNEEKQQRHAASCAVLSEQMQRVAEQVDNLAQDYGRLAQAWNEPSSH